MTVDPSDSSYMPSLIVTSIGETQTCLQEVKTTHVKENDTSVKLLENLREVGNHFVCMLKNSISQFTKFYFKQS